ncbi:MAG: hypothetical protein FWD69_16850 [Polyangiaceae bacterium]|nr:hypothetical protein [Polyangiaceae bacterium]
MRPAQTLPNIAEILPGVIEKRLTARTLHEPEAVARLRAEAILLRALGGRVTPALLDAGEDSRGPWLHMGKISSPTLAERLDNARGPLATAWIECASRAAFDALAVVHEAADGAGALDVVHADISPANLAIDDAGAHVTLLDFELACFRGSPARDGAFRGTAAFTAPEVARGESPTPKSDLYSLAATLAAAALGRSPRPPLPLPALLATAAEVEIIDDELRALGARGPAHAALLRCLAHDPASRPASAREIALSLRTIPLPNSAR